jgi:hypothetical protein
MVRGGRLGMLLGSRPTVVRGSRLGVLMGIRRCVVRSGGLGIAQDVWHIVDGSVRLIVSVKVG